MEGEYRAENTAIIREVYDSADAHEKFAEQLDGALEENRDVIIIEPRNIGDEVVRWIKFGNFLHKAAVVSGACCLLSPLLLPRPVSLVSVPLGATSVSCAALYGLSWQSDPCCKYQVDYGGQVIGRLRLKSLTSSSPIVLIRRDDKYRKRLHNGLAALAFVYCGFKIYSWLGSS